MDINREYNDIDEILKGHKPKIVEKDFYDLLLNEEIGRFMGESPDKGISVYAKIPMDKLQEIKTAIENTNQGKIHDLTLLATEVVNNIIWKYFNKESIDTEDFIDLTVREDEVDETVLSTSGTPTDETDLTPIKDETVLSTSNTPSGKDQPRTMKESLVNASYYENGKYVEDIPLDITELENAEIMDTDEQLALNPREEDIGSIFYREGKNIYAIKGEK